MPTEALCSEELESAEFQMMMMMMKLRFGGLEVRKKDVRDEAVRMKEKENQRRFMDVKSEVTGTQGYRGRRSTGEGEKEERKMR